MKNINTSFAKNRYLKLSELGSQLNLSFSSHLVLRERIIALDGIRKILLVSSTDNEMNNTHLIELSKVTAVSVKKTYSSIKAGELKKRRVEDFLKRIDLQFECIGEDKTIVLPFYEFEKDDLRDLQKLERNANNWHLILTKMLSMQNSFALN